jgi:hypothetical protein
MNDPNVRLINLDPGANMDERLGTVLDTTGVLDFHVARIEEYEKLGALWGTARPDVDKLRHITRKLDSDLAKAKKQPPSVERDDFVDTSRSEAKAAVAQWREKVGASMGLRVKVANDQLRKAIDERLTQAAGPHRQRYWDQLMAKAADPAVLTNLFYAGDDEIRSAIATMPK